MITQITKRDGEIVNYNVDKIILAISKANAEIEDETIPKKLLETIINLVENKVLEYEEVVSVEDIQDSVEESLLEVGLVKTARAYIQYREQQKQKRKLDIFSKRTEMKPYEYPELMEYADAIRNALWVVTEYNFTGDIQDFKTEAKPHEQAAVTNCMLAIAQIEVDVKTFWGKIYDRMPKYEIGAVGAVFSESECYIEGTEILTPRGWVDFRDIENGDLVAQYNHNNTIDFVPARNKIVKDVNGKLHHISKKHIDAYITPNHNMVMYRGKDAEKFELIPSSKLSGKNGKLFIPQAAKLNGERKTLTNMERLYIALQADGSFRTWKNSAGEKIPRGAHSDKQTYEISFKKQRKKDRFEEIIKNIESVKSTEYNIQSKEGYSKYSVDVDRDFNYKYFDWVDLSDKSWEWCEDFIQELIEWDGCRLPNKKDGIASFSTTNKEIADVAQAVATAAGYRVVITDYEDKRSDKYSNVYKMVFVENRERVTGTYNKEEVDYEGKVYCVEVESGAIITRYNDKVFISGNCRHAEAYSHLLEILGFNERFNDLKDIPVIQDRIDYLKRSASWANTGDEKDYVLSLILFSLFIEHTSLFSQFLIMMSFKKHKNMFSGLSNVIEATSLEEQLHGMFGIDIVNIVREERPEMFDERMEKIVIEMSKEAYEAEKKIVDWIFEEGELDFLPKKDVLEFIKNRLNNSLESVGYEKLFETDEELLENSRWFDDELLSSSLSDFLYKRSRNYDKFSMAIKHDTLFSDQSDVVKDKITDKNKVNEILRLRMLPQ